MKKLANLRGAKSLNKKEQIMISGGGDTRCWPQPFTHCFFEEEHYICCGYCDGHGGCIPK
jgi:hypothetical protein